MLFSQLWMKLSVWGGPSAIFSLVDEAFCTGCHDGMILGAIFSLVDETFCTGCHDGA